MADAAEVTAAALPMQAADEPQSGDEEDNLVGGAVVYTGSEEEGTVDPGAGDEAGSGANDPSASEIPGTGANRARWKDIGERVEMILSDMYTGESGAKVPADQPITAPVQAFDTFVCDEVIDALRKPTNRRAHIELGRSEAPPKILDNWKDVSRKEMKVFLVTLILIGLMGLPADTDYWSTGLLGYPVIKSLMSRDRWMQIKHCLSVANPSQSENADDKLAKVRPFLDLVQRIIRGHWTLGCDCGLDESQCRCGHRHARISHRGETKKPIADYVKVIALHESKSGYCWSFCVDTRTQTVREMLLDVVSKVPKDGGRRIATDRFYTGVDNAKAIRDEGHFMYGTIRGDRGPHKTGIKAQRDAAGGLEDGEFLWQMADLPLPMTMYLWRDSNKEGSWFFSTCHRDEEDTVTRRKRGHPTATKRCPTCAKDYNANMGACDQCNSLRASYSLQLTHKRRWYMCLVYYGLDVLLVNSYIWFKDITATPLSQKEYRLSVCESLIARLTTTGSKGVPACATKRKRVAQDLDLAQQFPTRHLHVGDHLPVWAAERKHCKLCYSRSKVLRRCWTFCNTCNVHLCLNKDRNCYFEFHSEQE